jgi:SAM-dependent methyltransferase
MGLWPAPADAAAPWDLAAIRAAVEAFAGSPLAPWETGYLEYHGRRYQDTLRLLPEGRGRRLLDVGSFPGHLSALARARGWEVTGLNNDIEGAAAWHTFLARCQARGIAIRACDVEREPFPADTASFDAVLFCELFEHLHWNPFHTLKEIFRVLAPGGVLVLTTPNWRRAETLFRFLHDWGAQPPVSRTFHELWPSLFYHRHNREYTGSELVYHLARQGKDLYDFRLEPIYYSDCLDARHEIPGVTGQRAGAVEQALARGLRRLVPATRGQLMARAWRSGATLVEWVALGAVDGLGPRREDDQPVQGFTRRLTFPFRLADARAGFTVPLPPGAGPVCLSLMVAHPAPADAPPLWTHWTVDGHPAMTLELRPGPRPRRVRLLVPAGRAAAAAARVAIATTEGPGVRRDPPDRLHVGAQWVLAERLPAEGAEAAIDALLAQTAAEQQAEESFDGWWHAAASLYVARRVTRPELGVGPGDEAQLGPGWYHREDWGPQGAMRWTGPEALVYLAAPGGATTLRIACYSGEPRLGGVAGRVAVEHAPPGEGFVAAGETPFELPADAWQELRVPVPPAPGQLRVTLRIDAPRVPRALVPGSQDDRRLGLAVRRLGLG